jgi:hypothetical protein
VGDAMKPTSMKLTKQQDKILKALQGSTKVPHYAFSSRYYVHNYTARINELRNMGYSIRQWKEKNRRGNMTSYYALEG